MPPTNAELISGVLDLFPGADRQALRVLADLLTEKRRYAYGPDYRTHTHDRPHRSAGGSSPPDRRTLQGHGKPIRGNRRAGSGRQARRVSLGRIKEAKSIRNAMCEVIREMLREPRP